MKTWIVKFLSNSYARSVETSILAPDRVQAKIVASILFGEDATILSIVEKNDQ